MLNPIIRKMYTEDVVNILDDYCYMSFESKNVECLLYGSKKTDTGIIVPKSIFVDKRYLEQVKVLSVIVDSIQDLMTPEELDSVCCPWSATNREVWDEYVKDKGIPLWVR